MPWPRLCSHAAITATGNRRTRVFWGDFAAGAASNLYYPAGSRSGATLTVENGLLSIGSDAVGNVVQEFVVRHLTRHPADLSTGCAVMWAPSAAL